MRLGVENLTGSFFYVDVEDDATVEGLKGAIASKGDELEKARLILMHSNGRVMGDDQQLAMEYGVADGSILYLFFTPVEPSQWPRLFEDCLSFVLVEG